MNIGSMRRRITLKQKQSTKDSEGLVTDQWIDYVTVWASYEDASRWKEFLAAAAVGAENYVKFTIRYRSDITTDMRVVFQNVEYIIINASDSNATHREIVLMCKRVVTGG